MVDVGLPQYVGAVSDMFVGTATILLTLSSLDSEWLTASMVFGSAPSGVCMAISVTCCRSSKCVSQRV